jgi:hypothetical protein
MRQATSIFLRIGHFSGVDFGGVDPTMKQAC